MSLRGTMRAATLVRTGSLDHIQVQDVPAPQVTEPGDVVVELRAAALNHLDIWVVEGLPGLPPSFPHVLGGDGAGVVAEVGSTVTAWKVGDRVMINPGVSCYRCEWCLAGEHSLCHTYQLLGEHRPGTLAERVLVPQHNLAPLPEERTWAEGAAYSLATLTAWRMLVTRARVQPNEWVLVWGIGGGVSLTALRIAKLLGATVVATSSSDAKLARARELGADHTINHRSEDVAQTVKALTHRRGVDVVVENPGEATWEESLRSLAKQGRVVTCGATTGPNVVTDIRRLFWHQHTIMGSTMGNAREYRAIASILARGDLVPIIDATYPLEAARKAMERLDSGGQMGKIVIEMGRQGG